MSSRSVRKLHGRNELEALEQALSSSQTPTDGSSSNVVDESSEEEVARPMKKNMFALALVSSRINHNYCLIVNYYLERI